MIGFRWSVMDYEPHEKTFVSYEECEKDIYPQYKEIAEISLCEDDGFMITEIIQITHNFSEEKLKKVLTEDE